MRAAALSNGTRLMTSRREELRERHDILCAARESNPQLSFQ
jgi:hypothetical protein